MRERERERENYENCASLVRCSACGGLLPLEVAEREVYREREKERGEITKSEERDEKEG